ncbi:acyl-CoA dehydrogenase family protein [Ilumatobacter sp.]|uniref:acyl-CoA dehydrogenase family protein n=1 Tax=Ilumatobacter sp. TaxID=1967498 RepID=UPI003B515916
MVEIDEMDDARDAPTVDEFGVEAAEWLARNAEGAPPDYGAICPPHLIEAGIEWHRRVRDAGYAGIHWPTEHGGRGLSAEHNARWLLECARAGVPPMLNMVGLVLTGQALQMYGTDAQRDLHLRATLDADHVWCQLFSEPGAGSDLGSLTTRAVADGDRFVVDGQKVWCSGGRYSDWGILMARTRPIDPDAGVGKHDGISFFLCPMDLDGIEIRPLQQMTGEAEFDEVFFTEVELPADHLLGPLHGGWGVAMSVLTNERGHIGTAVISLQRRLDQMIALSSERELDALDRQHLAELVATGTAFKALARRQGSVASTAASLLKLGITEMSFATAMLRGELAGAGSTVDGPTSYGMLAAPGGRIAGGTSQVQRNIIGERLLGLPREPRPER